MKTGSTDRRGRCFITWLAVLFILAAAGTLLAEQHAPSADEIAALGKVADVRISPDGARIVYTLTTYNRDTSWVPTADDPSLGWNTDRQIHLIAREGGNPVQLTRGDEKSGSPRWSPDGEIIAFLRKVDGKTAIHILPVSGGEARVVDTGELEPTSFAWSPDGARFAFIATPPESEAELTRKASLGDVYLYGEQYRPDCLFTVPVEGGDVERVTQGVENIVEFDWSPDGTSFAVLTSESSDPYYVSNLLTPRIISATDGGEIKRLEDDPGGMEEIRWSPDGKYVSYLKCDSTLSLLNALMVHEADGEGVWNAAFRNDFTMLNYAWSSDSRGFYVHVIERTKPKIYLLSRDGLNFRAMDFSGREMHGTFSLDRNGRYLACATSTYRNPPDPTVLDMKKERFKTVVEVNPQVKDWAIGEQEIVRWTDPEGVEIEGLLLHPPNTTPGKPAPLMVHPHGGPDWVSRESWSRWSVYFAGRGYSVFRPNYRGSLGYGYDFYAANRGRLGEVEFADIESGVDALIENGKADPERLVYGGWSWGGYLTEWTIGHTDRYKAAVVGAGVADVVEMYALSDINHGVAALWEYRGDPWRQTANFDNSNPYRSFKNAVTPTLILHGEKDQRVPFSQGIFLYRALKDVGCEVKFYAYPGEPHGFRRPEHTAHYLQVWGDWFDDHLAR